MNTLLKLSNSLDSLSLSAIRMINDVAYDLGIPSFIIGATARDVILKHGFGLESFRATKDIDFAVQVEKWEQFDKIKQELIATKYFTPAKNLHRLYFQKELPIDILPFGSLTNDNRLSWPPDFDSEMDIDGFVECYQYSIQVQLQEKPSIIVRVASLEGLTLLKIISWDENPHIRNKDALDLFTIMVNYIDAGNDSRLYEEAADIFDEDSVSDYDIISARFLGRNISAMLKSSEALRNKLKHILHRETETDRIKGLIQSIVVSGAWPQYDYQQVSNLFSSLLKGLSE